MTRDLPLFQRLLGQSWEQLPQAIRRLHSVTGVSTFSGECTVERGSNPLAQIVARVAGFPTAGARQKIMLQLSPEAAGERWTRNVAGREFSSLLRLSRSSAAGVPLLQEQLGVVAVDMEVAVADETLKYVVCHWYLLGIPLPLWLGPQSTARESTEDGRVRFDVEIRHILIGLIVGYHGWLIEDTR